jgi:hypothetical protein
MSGCGCQCENCDSAGHDAHGTPPPSWLAELFADTVGLAGITPDAASAQAIGAGTGLNDSSKANILASARAGQMINAGGSPAYIPGTADCAAAGTPATNVALNTIIGTAGMVAPFTGPAAPFVALGAGLVGLFSGLLNHHKLAVKKEQSILCSAVPAANNYLQLISQAVQSGQSSPQDAIHALDSLLSDFRSNVGSIAHQCNAACVMTLELQAIVLELQSQYQDLIAAQNTGQVVSPARPNTTTAPTGTPTSSSYSSFYSGAQPASTPFAGLPSWLPIAAAVAAGIFLMREL